MSTNPEITAANLPLPAGQGQNLDTAESPLAFLSSKLEIMLDIETVSQEPDASIYEFGYCLFNASGIKLAKSFSIELLGEDGCNYDVETLAFLRKHPASRAGLMDAILHPQGNLSHAVNCMQADFTFCHNNNYAAIFAARIWAWRSQFDFPIIRAQLKREGEINSESLWGFCQEICAMSLHATFASLSPRKVPDYTGAHNAENDCVAQAETLINLNRTLSKFTC